MQKNTLKKGLVLGIILLFVGAGITPSIGGNISGHNNIEKEDASEHKEFNIVDIPILDGGTEESEEGNGHGLSKTKLFVEHSNDISMDGSLLFIRGTTHYVGGTGPNNYTKIQDAIDNTTEGDTVFVYDDSSPYYENIYVNKRINLIGEDQNTTIIDGNDSGNAVYLTGNRVNISCFTIQNSGGSYDGIDIRSDYNIISSNIIKNNDWYGVHLHGSSNNIICNNYFFNNKVGSLSGKYYNNYPSDNYIVNNIFYNNSCGISSYDSKKFTITNNIICNNTYGIYLSCSHNFLIKNNKILNNSYRGIFFYVGGTSIKIIKNKIMGSNTGIEKCGYQNNGRGFNIVYCNNFVNNTHNVKIASSSYYWSSQEKINYTYKGNNYTNYLGNYWDDYNGSDDDSDGIGDTPYIINNDNDDNYPLMEPWEDYFTCVEGIDVSEHQGKINWTKVANDNYNVNFSFIRTTLGDNETPTLKDKYCIENIKNASDNDIIVGVYHFGYPDYGDETHKPEKEADWFVKFNKRYMHNGFMRPALDIEDDNESNAHPKDLEENGLAQWIIDFMDDVTEKTKDITSDGLGISPLLYINNDYATFLNRSDEDKVNKLKEYDLWFALWRCNIDNPPQGDDLVIWKDEGWDFWQYYGPKDCGDNTGFIDGINAPVDLDVFNGSWNRFQSEFIISNSPNKEPDKPIINGPSKGKAGIEYKYSFLSKDSHNDNVSFYIEWDDDTFIEYTDWYQSEEIAIFTHTYEKPGNYIIKAKAKDDWDESESEWGYLEVTMPVNKPHSKSQSSNLLFFQILQRIFRGESNGFA